MSIMKPLPGSPMRWSSVRTTSSRYTSQNGMHCWPILCSGAVETPGVSILTNHRDMLPLSWLGSSSLATTMV